MRNAPVHAVLAAVVLAASDGARATTGGPLTVEVLGWDATDERIYVRQVGHDESGGERDCVFYFDLRATSSLRPHVVVASRVRWSSDPAEMDRFERERARLERFLARLRPLERADEGRESILRRARVVDESTVAPLPGMDPLPRFIVEVGDSILAVAWREPCVRAVRRYRIPGRDAELVVLSFIGNPFEECYEIQRAVLMGLPGGGVQRLESPNGVLPWPPRH